MASLGVVLAITAAVYWPGLNGPLILDDVANLGALRALEADGQLTFRTLMEDRPAGLAARPLSMLAFLWNWKLTGDDIWSLKLGNLLIHLVCGGLAYALGRLLLGQCPSVTPRTAHWAALWAAAAWLLAPMQVSTVLYVVQRMAQLAAMFSLLGLVCYCWGRRLLDTRAALGTGLVLCALLVCWPLAALSKENGVLLPLLVLLMEAVFFTAPRRRSLRWLIYLLLGTSLVVPVVVAAAKAMTTPEWVLADYAQRDFTLAERLMTQPRVLIDYAMSLLQLPGASPLGLFHDDFVKSESLTRPPSTLAALLLWVALPVALLVFRRTDAGALLWGPTFFLCAHLLEAGPFALEPYFEHRNYLPAAGLFIGIGIGVAFIVRRGRHHGLISVGLILIAITYAAVAGARVLTWTSWEGIVSSAALSHPRSARAQAGKAILHLQAGRLDEAMPLLSHVEALGGPSRRYGVVLKTLTGFCIARRQPPERLYRRLEGLDAISDDMYTVGALRWLRTRVTDEGCESVDLRRVAHVLDGHARQRRGPGALGQNWSLHYDVGRLLAVAGRGRGARRQLEQAYRYAPASRLTDIRRRLDALDESRVD